MRRKRIRFPLGALVGAFLLEAAWWYINRPRHGWVLADTSRNWDSTMDGYSETTGRDYS